MKHSCDRCAKTYTRAYDLKRHIKDKHGDASEFMEKAQPTWNHSGQVGLGNDGRDTPVIKTIQNKTPFFFKHPFSMIIAAPSGAGKTCLVKKILENRSRWIQPSPQRIIWLYGQWQPLYEEMQRTIPGIEFIKGIPWNLDEESFLDARVRNLIVIDDLMTQATKDSKICDLFTKGSHHRNLSVLCLVQNLYYHGRENRTMSLNSSYLILFKNARDEQQVMTLSRQICPGNSQRMMQIYKSATEKPYGYLVIDLKPGTSDSCRFQANVLEDQDTLSEQVEKPVISTVQDQVEQTPINQVEQTSINKVEGEQILEEIRQLHQAVMKNNDDRIRDKRTSSEEGPPGKRLKRETSEESYQSDFDSPSIDMPSCQKCGAYYATWEDLKRHQDRNCPESYHKNGKVKKKMSPEEEGEIWLDPVKKEVNEEVWDEYQEKTQEMMDQEGVSKERAMKEAYNEMLPRLRKRCRQAVADYLIHMRQVQETDTYRKLMQTIESLMEEEEFTIEEAIRQALTQRKFLFEQWLPKRNLEEEDVQSETESEVGDEESDS